MGGTPNVSRTWTYTYNGYGQVLTIDGPRTDVSDVTTVAYYSCATGTQCGQINTLTNALGQITTFNTYNAYGQYSDNFWLQSSIRQCRTWKTWDQHHNVTTKLGQPTMGTKGDSILVAARVTPVRVSRTLAWFHVHSTAAHHNKVRPHESLMPRPITFTAQTATRLFLREIPIAFGVPFGCGGVVPVALSFPRGTMA